MSKQKLKTVALGLLIAVVAALLVFFSYLLISKMFNKDSEKSISVAPVQSAEEIAMAQESDRSYDKLTESANGKDYALTAKLAHSYASDPANSYETRLDAYRVCIQKSVLANDSNMKDSCYQEGKTYTQSLSDQELKDYWLKYLDEVYTGLETQANGGDDEVQ